MQVQKNTNILFCGISNSSYYNTCLIQIVIQEYLDYVSSINKSFKYDYNK